MWNETLDVVIVREALGLPSTRLVIASPASGHHIRQTRPAQGLLLVFEGVVAFDPILSEEEVATINAAAQYASSSAASGTSASGGADTLSRTKIIHDARVKSKAMHCWTTSGRNLSIRTSTEGTMLLVDNAPAFNFVSIEETDAVVNAIRLVAMNPTDREIFKQENLGRIIFPKDSERLDGLSRRHGYLKNESVVASLYGTLITNYRIFVGTSSYILSEIPFVAVELDGTIIVSLDHVQKLVLKTSTFRQGILLRMWLESVMEKADELQRLKMEEYSSSKLQQQQQEAAAASTNQQHNNSGHHHHHSRRKRGYSSISNSNNHNSTSSSAAMRHQQNNFSTQQQRLTMMVKEKEERMERRRRNNNQNPNNTNNDDDDINVGSLPRMHALLALHRQFCAVSHGEGMISKNQLRELMQPLYPNSKISESMFRFFDTDDSGEISFDEFASGMIGLLSPEGLSHYDRYRFTFSLFDTNGDGLLSETEVKDAISLMQKTGLAGASTASIDKNKETLRETVREIFRRLKGGKNNSSSSEEQELTVEEFVAGLQREDIVRLLSQLGVDAGSLVRFPAARLSAELLTPQESEWSRVAAIMHAIQSLIYFYRNDPAAKNFEVKTHFVNTDYMIPRVLHDLEKLDATTTTGTTTATSIINFNNNNNNNRNNNQSDSEDEDVVIMQNTLNRTSNHLDVAPVDMHRTPTAPFNDDDDDNALGNTNKNNSYNNNGNKKTSPPSRHDSVTTTDPFGPRMQSELLSSDDKSSMFINNNTGSNSYNMMKNNNNNNSSSNNMMDNNEGGSPSSPMPNKKFRNIGLDVYTPAVSRAMQQLIVGELQEFEQSFAVDDISGNLMLGSNSVPKRVIDPLRPNSIRYDTQDGRYTIQSVSEVEFTALVAANRKLVEHVVEHPNSFVPRYIALFTVNAPEGMTPLYFYIKQNPQPVGKFFPMVGECSILMDGPPLTQQMMLDPGWQETVLGQLEADVECLCNVLPYCKVMLKSTIFGAATANISMGDAAATAVGAGGGGVGSSSSNNNNGSSSANNILDALGGGGENSPENEVTTATTEKLSSAVADDATIGIPRPGPLQSKISVQTFNKLYVRDYTPATVEVVEAHPCCSWFFHSEKVKGKRKKDQVIAVGSLATKLRATKKSLLPKKRALSDIRANNHPICFELVFTSVTEAVDEETDERIPTNGPRSYLDVQDRPKGPTEQEKQCLPYLRRPFLDFVRRSLGTRRAAASMHSILLESPCIADTVVTLNGTEGDLSIDRHAKQLFLAWNGRTLFHANLRANNLKGFGFFRRKHPMTYSGRRELQLRSDLDVQSGIFKSETVVKFVSTAALERFCEEITRTTEQVKSFVPGQENPYLGNLRVCSIVWNLGRRSPPDQLSALFEKAYDCDLVLVYATECYYFPQAQAADVTCEEDWFHQLDVTLSAGFKTISTVSAANGRLFVAASYEAFSRISDVETSVACVPGPLGLSQATCISVSLQVDNSTVAAVCVDLPQHVKDEATRWLILQALFQSLPMPTRSSTGASASSWTTPVEWGERSCIDFLDRHNHVLLLGDFRCKVEAPKLDIISGLTRGKLDLVVAADSLKKELARDAFSNRSSSNNNNRRSSTAAPAAASSLSSNNNNSNTNNNNHQSVLASFNESDINFPPTGPFLCGATSNDRRIYDEDNACEPRWTGRVLWRSVNPPTLFDAVNPVYYGSTTSEITTSPHNPVISVVDVSTRRQYVDAMRRNSGGRAVACCTKLILTNIRVTAPVHPLENPFLPSTSAKKPIPNHFNGGLVFANPFFGQDVCASSVVEDSNCPVWKDVLEVFIEGVDTNLFATTNLTATLSHVDNTNDYHRIASGLYSLEALVGSSTKLLRREAMPLYSAGVRVGTLTFDMQLFLA